MSDNVEERLEDVFDEVIKRFRSREEFFQFARSKNGLKIDQHDITPIREDNPTYVGEQKFEILSLWRQKLGPAASPALIRQQVETYLQSQTASDATGVNMEDPQPVQTQVPTEGSQMQFVQNKRNCNGTETVNITNIQGPIQGPVLMGNQQVSIGGDAGPQGDAGIDPDVPQLKSSVAVSATEKTTVHVGGCSVKFQPHTVREETTVELSYKVDLGPPPDDHTPVTSALSCDPSFRGRKKVKVKLATWCSTEKSVDVGIFTKDEEEGWKEIERPIFTQESHFELHYCDLDNLAAFVRTDRLEDVWFKISCFLYNDADGKFAMGFCLNDEAIENVFLHRLKKEKFVCTIERIEPISALLSDEILFRITPGQQMQNTKFEVDRKFVSSFQGYVSHCTIDKDASNPQYFITHKRQGRVVTEEAYYIHGRDADATQEAQSELSSGSTSVEFRGKVRADNWLGQVENADIDMRKMGPEDDEEDSQPFWNKDQLSYEQHMQKRDDALRRKDEILKKRGLSQVNAPKRGKRGGASVVFHGDVEAKTMITGAKNVRIDQRQMRGKKPQKKAGTEIERVVVAEQEAGGGTGEEKPGTAEGVVERMQHTENQPFENRAEPIWKDCEQNRGGVTAENGRQRREDAAPETNVRQRRVGGEERQDQVDPPIPEQKFDALHRVLAIMLFACLLFLMYTSYSS